MRGRFVLALLLVSTSAAAKPPKLEEHEPLTARLRVDPAARSL